MAFLQPQSAMGLSQPLPYAGTANGYQPFFYSGERPTQTGYVTPMDTPGFPAGSTMPPLIPSGSVIPGAPDTSPAAVLQEESYVENILRMNLGKRATVYATYENNSEWNAKVFSGILKAAGRDHLILADEQTGKRVLLLMVNVDYITFDEELTYTLPFGITAVSTGR